jgi:hypothetical protein
MKRSLSNLMSEIDFHRNQMIKKIRKMRLMVKQLKIDKIVDNLNKANQKNISCPK